MLTVCLLAGVLVFAPAALKLPGATSDADTPPRQMAGCAGGTLSSSWAYPGEGSGDRPGDNSLRRAEMQVWVPKGATVHLGNAHGVLLPRKYYVGPGWSIEDYVSWRIRTSDGSAPLSAQRDFASAFFVKDSEGHIVEGPNPGPQAWADPDVAQWTNSGSAGVFVRAETYLGNSSLVWGGGNTWNVDVSVTLNGTSTTLPSCKDEMVSKNAGQPSACSASPSDKDPINLAQGAFWETTSDLSVPGRGPALDWGRTYMTTEAATNGPLGYGWRFAYGVSLAEDAATNMVTIAQENGSRLRFFGTSTGWEAPPRVNATLTKLNATTFELNRGGNQIFTFVSGKLTSIRDLSGNTTTLGYVSGQLASITGASGRTLTVTWQSGRIWKVSAGSTQLVTGGPATTIEVVYAYDGAGNLSTVTDPQGGIWTYGYDASHRVTTIREPRHHSLGAAAPVLENHYDALGRVDWQEDRLDRRTTISYGDAGDFDDTTTVTTLTDPMLRVTQYEFTNGLCTGFVRDPGPNPSRWVYELDPLTLGRATTTDPNGNVTTATFDGRGRRTSVTTPKGTSSVVFNAQGMPTTTTDPSLVTTTFTYDLGTDRLRSVSRPIVPGTGSATTLIDYLDPANPGLPTKVVDERGKVWLSTYSTSGDLASSKDPLLNLSTTTYNSLGWPLYTVAPKGNAAGPVAHFTSSVSYDKAGRVLSMTDELGQRTELDRDLSGNVIARRDPVAAGTEQTGFTINAAGEITTVIRPGGSMVTSEYWADGQLKTQRDAANAPTGYTYDARGRLETMTDPAGRVTTLGYDPGGRLATRQQPGGDCAAVTKVKCVSYGYNAADELTSVVYSDDPGANVSYGYDVLGRRTSMVDAGGSSAWTWDSLGRLLSSADPAGTVAYGYDDAGAEPTSVTYPGAKTVARTIDDAGRVLTTSGWVGGSATYGYDANSNPTTLDTGATTGVEDTYDYDRTNLMSAATVRQGAATLTAMGFTRDPEGMVTTRTATGIAGAADTFTYNGIDQLATSSAGTFAYDSADNPTGFPGGTKQRFNAANELCYIAATNTAGCSTPPAGATTVTYDGRGNRTGKAKVGSAPTTMVYDQADRLKSATLPTALNASGQYHDLSQSPLLLSNPAALYALNTQNFAAGETRTLQITGNHDVPAGAGSVVLRLNAGNVTNYGHVTAYANGTTPVLNTTSMFVDTGEFATELAVSDLDATGKLKVTASAAMTISAEVVGWYSATPAAGGLTFTAMNLTRALGAVVGAGSTTNVTVTGVGSVPSTGVSAVAVTVHSVNPTGPGYMTAYSGTQPGSATLAFDSPANSAFTIVPVVGGQIKLYSSVAAYAAIDIAGWYGPVETGGGAIAHQLTPAYAMNTLNGYGTCNAGACTRFTANTAVTVDVTGVAGVPATGAASVAVLLHTWQPAGTGALLAYANGSPVTGGAAIYDTSSPYVTTMLILPVDTNGNITLLATTDVDVLVQAIGWYEPAVKTTSFTYSGDGLRRTKTSPDGTITTFVWDRRVPIPELLAETIDAPGTTNDRTVRYIHGPGGTITADITTPAVGAETIRWYHHDSLGSTTALTNATGAVIGTYSYTPTGLTAQTSGTATTPMSWTGEYRDPETGLTYLRARYYDPATAQFLTRDPLESVTRSAYGYAGNNPVNFTDPTGLCWGPTCLVEDAVDWVDDHSKGLAQIGTGIAFLGYAVCPVTAGIGCAVGGTASFASAGLYANSARHECAAAGIVSSACALATLDASLSATGALLPGRLALQGRGAHNAYAGMRTWMSQSFWNIGINGALNFLGGAAHSLFGGESFFGMDPEDC